MATITSFKDLRVWQLGIGLAADIYHLTGELPEADRSDLAANLQKTAVAIPTLIAAGHKSGKRIAMLQASLHALERANELETLLIISGELHPSVPSNDILDNLEDVRRALETIVKRLTPPKQPSKSV